MQKGKKKVVVIGGGISGLAVAALLGKDGYQVTLFEKNKDLGGRARVLKDKGYSFDMGPSWYMMPEAFERYFALFGKKPSDYYNLKLLTPRYRFYHSKGNYFDLTNEIEKDKELFESIEHGSAEQLTKYLKKSTLAYRAAAEKVVYQPLIGVLDLLRWRNLKEGLRIIKAFNPFISFDSLVGKYFRNENLIRILEFTTVFLGGSPFNLPALYILMSHSDFVDKIWYPEGGMVKIVNALVSLCRENGVVIKTQADVSKINTNQGIASGVVVDKRNIPADIVISAADYPYTEMVLLDKAHRSYDRSYWESKKLAASSLNLFVVLKHRLTNVAHHNFFITPEWRDHFDSMFKDLKWPKDPSFYLSVRSKTDSSLVPDGYEELFILVPLAPGLPDTDEAREKVANRTIKRLEEYIGEEVKSKIVYRRIYSQRDYQADYHAYKGGALGLAHTLKQSIFLRPANKSKKVNNLYYCGQYTQPGIGVPIQLISAQITKSIIEKSSPQSA